MLSDTEDEPPLPPTIAPHLRPSALFSHYLSTVHPHLPIASRSTLLAPASALLLHTALAISAARLHGAGAIPAPPAPSLFLPASILSIQLLALQTLYHLAVGDHHRAGTLHALADRLTHAVRTPPALAAAVGTLDYHLTILTVLPPLSKNNLASIRAAARTQLFTPATRRFPLRAGDWTGAYKPMRALEARLDALPADRTGAREELRIYVLAPTLRARCWGDPGNGAGLFAERVAGEVRAACQEVRRCVQEGRSPWWVEGAWMRTVEAIEAGDGDDGDDGDEGEEGWRWGGYGDGVAPVAGQRDWWAV
ncbi:hypothetical protein EDC01DRAFT_404474 [Geopyxis carbonaria]|nr:hypothetical protein EDC01DRAFT_404474 [Geopyxis carbonaria]